MPIPFKGQFPVLRKHTEDEYLKLENMFNNLLISVEALSVISEDDSNFETKLNRLVMRIEQIVPEYQEFRESLTLQGKSSLEDSATTNDSPYAFRVTKKEHKMILDSLEHLALMLGKDDREFDLYMDLKKGLEV